jgi:hypothetical protein
MILEDHATFQKVLNKSGKKKSQLCDSVGSQSTNISSIAPSDPESQARFEKANLRLRLSENEKLIAILREQVIDTINRNAQLAQQLKQAVASKCELVVACSEIETQKLSVEEKFEKEYRKAHMKPLKERETRAQVEKDFMNELDRVLGEMNDMYRRHRNTVLEKDMEIALLHERICQEQWRRSN